MHRSVLLQEAITGLTIRPGEIFLDGTLGNGGHTEEVVKQFGTSVRIICLDEDSEAIERSKKRLAGHEGTIAFIESNFRNLDLALDRCGVEKVDKILFDIGTSSEQIEASGRGFSFQKNEPLQMTFKVHPNDEDLTASTILNEWSEDSIATILWGFGGERYARRIASKIVQARARAPITSTETLVDIILEATPQAYHHRPIHPATKTFQALRIAVNDELGALEEGLRKGFERLNARGRMAVISFHSLEDRIVKNFYKARTAEKLAITITKKPITPSADELKNNRRARSAKLRILEKL